MSDHQRQPDRADPERERAAPPQDEQQSAARRDASGSVPGLPDRLRQAGNAAISRLLRRRGAGRPLDPQSRAPLERGFGANFGAVRLHDDQEARAAADALDATALTQGDDIYLGSAAPPPETADGQQLLAHELAHVAQQRQAGAVNAGQVSRPGDSFEQAADHAAQQVVQGDRADRAPAGTPPAIQRQERMPQPGVARAEAQAALRQYLERLAAQTDGKVRVTPELRTAVEQMFAGDVGAILRLDGFFNRLNLPTDPATFAAEVARLLPETIEPARIAHLRRAPSSGTQPSFTTRVADAAKRTAPAPLPPDEQSAQWRFDQETGMTRKEEARRAGQPSPIGPYSVDILRAARIVGELTKKPATTAAPQLDAKVSAAIEQAVAQIRPDALIPPKLRNTPLAGSLADAQEVARALGRMLDQAHTNKQAEVELRLSADYRQAGDLGEVIDAMRAIIDIMREALPHKAANVEAVKVYFGGQLPRRFKVAP